VSLTVWVMQQMKLRYGKAIRVSKGKEQYLRAYCNYLI